MRKNKTSRAALRGLRGDGWVRKQAYRARGATIGEHAAAGRNCAHAGADHSAAGCDGNRGTGAGSAISRAAARPGQAPRCASPPGARRNGGLDSGQACAAADFSAAFAERSGIDEKEHHREHHDRGTEFAACQWKATERGAKRS